ncbi:protein disulfide oxidoreductase [Testudinibacter sp. TR-2022]|uniref:protein disulfide oxidoreductase n=1 Tax=Testudinibacter sp. TR-2022 TaxID=2585029 RepID=UPI00111A0DD5|nr:protein disulfide oxidoreductase [Testudinibacter sp. TR-2022]TNH03888.1 protein disulfide oxidoreductase [Pasteurellaceae bacterium Phil31]TNH07684.1 protein disulfide oxidoreductase [Testudinibacter sp. TR-2022]TNH08779.1 protein disulfide oxidoreductase [Testudinibacter sp. TR-2022]TNH10788.1 protein disulfide oxidoreductase [Testudinibacter sp. TR-2022]TNH18381.1 protein disulfide oxidoreductase [Testudinibacter sp. TR-2022]
MNLKKIGKNLLSLFLTFIVISLILDWYRKPEVPPDAATTALYDLQQQPFFLAQLSQDRPAILYFWGTWCSYCRYTSPAIDRLAKEGVPVVTVALRSGDTETVQAYLDKHQYQFTSVNDPKGTIAAQWQVAVTPTIIIFDQGKMEFATTGLSSYWGLNVRLWLAQWF